MSKMIKRFVGIFILLIQAILFLFFNIYYYQPQSYYVKLLKMTKMNYL